MLVSNFKEEIKKLKINSLNIKSLLLTVFFGLSITTFAQEICGNGIDDDNDGLVDCYDGDCASDQDCQGFYYGGVNPSCEVNYVFNPEFGLNLVWKSIEQVNENIPLIAGDVTGDGVPNIIAPRKNANQIFVLNGQTGNTEGFIAQTIDEFSQGGGLLDVRGIGGAEMFFINTNGLLYAYSGNGVGLTSYQITQVGYDSKHSVWNPQFADFDEDGTAEIYIGNQIYSASNGSKKVEAGSDASRGTADGDESSRFEEHNNTFAADVLPDGFCANCEGVELIAGNEVYSVHKDGGNWTLTLESSIENEGNYRDGKVSVADWDNDGALDIICSSSKDDNDALIYIWNPRDTTILGNSADGGSLASNPFNPNSLIATSFSSSKLSVLTIADVDGDGYPEIGGSSEGVIFMLDHDLTELWSKSVNNGAGINSITAFDFEGDGSVEVLYQTLDSLIVLDAATGNSITSTPCSGSSNNTLAKPIVVDATADGRANIVCTCGNAPIPTTSHVNVFNSVTNDWRPTKKFWNQYSFDPTILDDNLTILAEAQDPTKVAGHNIFLSQVAHMATSGDLVWLEENCDSVRLIVADGEINNDWYPQYNEVINEPCDGVEDEGLGLTYPETSSEVSFRAYSATGIGDLTSLDFSIQSLTTTEEFRVTVLDTANQVMVDSLFTVTTNADTISADLSGFQNSSDLVGEIKLVAKNNAAFCIDCIKFTNSDRSVWTREVALNDLKFGVTTQGIRIWGEEVLEKYLLFDLSGKKVLEGKINGNQGHIITSALSKGVYVLKVTTKDVHQVYQVKVALR